MNMSELGKVVVFYSFKGGTGRTMALANVGCALAKGARLPRPILLVDWDLEAPGLHRYFRKYLSKSHLDNQDFQDRAPGLIDLFFELEDRISKSDTINQDDISLITPIIDQFPFTDYICKTDINDLHLLKAGCFDHSYASKIGSFKWQELYRRWPNLLRIFSERLARDYSFISIDSRTGLTDTGGICTMVMPEILVAVFTPNRQSLLGLIDIVQEAARYRAQSDDLRPLVVYPLPSRIEASEPSLRQSWRVGDQVSDVPGFQRVFEETFKTVYALAGVNLDSYFDDVQIQHIPRYAYGEEIAVLVEEIQDRFSLTRSYQRFAAHLLLGMPPWEVAALSDDIFSTDWVDKPRARIAQGISQDISRIDRYAPAKLVGRETETKILDDAWAKARNDEQNRPHVLTFVALGGEGKTSLVAKWAAELAYKGWPGCEAAFAWSFYSQGTREQTAASSDLFFKAALVFFGDAETAEGARSAFDKGKRLAQLVAEKRALLILDGLEPLQYAPTSPMRGELKDEGLRALLKGLAQNNRGLCVVTTRYSISDLRAFRQGAAPEIALKRLPKAAGVALLRTLGVKGTQAEYEKLVEDVKGHALTLNLLGSFLRDAHGGDIRQRDLVKLKEADEEEQNGHAFRAMDAYAQWFEGEGEKGLRALALLRLLGLFDRPADAGCLVALWREPAIEGLTEPLVAITEAQRNIVTERLEDAYLLTVNREKSGAPVSLDTHPLLREYFAKVLRENQAAWQAAHNRLFEHLCKTTEDKEQPTLDDLQPLYQAVAHGCQAGLQQEACDKVYCDRILRGMGSDGTRKLGAIGSDIGAVACFFDAPWSRVSDRLAPAAQAWLLNEAAFRLRALGRLTEALEPIRAGLKMGVEQEDWINAAISASNLSELELTLGDAAGAVKDAEVSVTQADRCGNAFWRMGSRTTHANALHLTGRHDAAAARFAEPEAMQAEWQPGYPLLYSQRGFRYCDLLLAAAEREAWRLMISSSPPFLQSRATGEAGSDMQPRGDSGSLRSAREDGMKTREILIDSCRAVAERVAQTLQWTERSSMALLDLALDHLTVGRAKLFAAVLAGGPPGDPCRQSLRDAVDGLRRAGDQSRLPLGLLTRAWLRRLDGDFSGAKEDLDEACEIAERGPMPLYLADIHLHRARLFGAGADRPAAWGSATADLAEARRLIEKHGYLRRKEELEDAESALQAMAG